MIMVSKCVLSLDVENVMVMVLVGYPVIVMVGAPVKLPWPVTVSPEAPGLKSQFGGALKTMVLRDWEGLKSDAPVSHSLMFPRDVQVPPTGLLELAALSAEMLISAG